MGRVRGSVNKDGIKIHEDNHNKQDQDKDTKSEKGGEMNKINLESTNPSLVKILSHLFCSWL